MSHGDALPRPPLHSWLFYVFDGIFLSGRVGLEREPSALWWRYAPHSFLPPKKRKRRERFEKNGREWRWNECVKANGGREKTECANITGSKDYSCHFQWILVSHSLFSSYIFFLLLSSISHGYTFSIISFMASLNIPPSLKYFGIWETDHCIIYRTAYSGI